jgi:sugar-specific transcriptional regulator TrmB
MERILELLQELGLSTDEAEVYVHLAKKGSHTIKALTENLGMTQSSVVTALKKLEKKQIAARKTKHSTYFSAITFERLLTDYVKIQFNKAKRMEEKRFNLIADWREMIEKKEPTT